MNVTWRLPSEELEEQFVKEATKARDDRAEGPPLGRRHPRQHLQRRARVACVEALVSFMKEFERKNG